MKDINKKEENEFGYLRRLFHDFDNYAYKFDIANAEKTLSLIKLISYELIKYQDPYLIITVRNFVIDAEQKLNSLHELSKNYTCLREKNKILYGDETIISEIREKLKNFRFDPTFKALEKTSTILVILLFIMLFSGLFYFRPAIFGFFTGEQQAEYTDSINLGFRNNTNITWLIENIAEINSLKISGKVSEKGNARVYLRHNYTNYLIFDSSHYKANLKITGYAVNDNSTNSQLNDDANVITSLQIISGNSIINESQLVINSSIIINGSNDINQSINETLTNNGSINELKKEIILDFEYGSNEFYDINNDGIEEKEGIIDFDAKGRFNWPIDESKLCTLYEAYSLDKKEGTLVCYGNDLCCNLLNLAPYRKSWNESFFLNYERFGTTEINEISARLIYADISLETENPISDIVYSEWQKLDAVFYNPLKIDKYCIETCSLSDFNERSYEIIIELDDAVLVLENITYTSKYGLGSEVGKISTTITKFDNGLSQIALNDEFGFFKIAKNVNIVNASISSNKKIKIAGKDFNNGIINFTQFLNDFINEQENVSVLVPVYGKALAKDLKIVQEISNYSLFEKSNFIDLNDYFFHDNKLTLNFSYQTNQSSIEIINVSIDNGLVSLIPIAEGDVKLRFIASDGEYIEYSNWLVVSSFTELADFNFSIKDSKGIKHNATIVFIDDKSKKLAKKISNKDEFIGKVKKGSHKIKVSIENGPVREIELNEADVSNNTLEFVNIDDVPENISAPLGNWEEVYAIDPLKINFTNATVKVTAKGNKLFKCKDWNFSSRECFGTWSYIMDIIPGNNYTITLTKEDPGFGEIIVITNAQHLDGNYSFISDIYDEVIEKDDYWSEPIYATEYVRVKFEKNLTSENDITVYARNNMSSNTYIEVYYFNSSEKITEFPIITETGYYKVLLIGMNGSHDTFDLKIVGNYLDYLEFDHIIDPTVRIKPGATGGLVMYGVNTWTTPRYRLWNATSKDFTHEYNTSPNLGASSTVNWVIVKSSTRRNQTAVGILDAAGDIAFNVRNNTDGEWLLGGWLNASNIGTTNDAYRGFDIDVESLSGDFIFVYENGTGTNKNLSYRIWNGTAMSNESLISLPNSTANEAQLFVVLKRHSDSNDIMMASAGTSDDISASRWDGDKWTDLALITASAAAVDQERFSIAWEGISGNAMIAWGENSANANYTFWYRANQSWAPDKGIIQNRGAAVEQISLCSDPGSNYIGTIIGPDAVGDVLAQIWNGSNWTTNYPLEDDNAERTTTQNAKCRWMTNGNTALFVYVAKDSLKLSYFEFNISASPMGNWSCPSNKQNVTSLANAEGSNGPCTSLGSMSDDVQVVKLIADPDSSDIMILGMDILEDIEMFIFNRTSINYWNITQPTTALLNATTATVTPTEPGDFDYFRFDWTLAPKWSNNATNATEPYTTKGDNVNFSINWTDDYGLNSIIFSYDNGSGNFKNVSSLDFSDQLMRYDTNVSHTLVNLSSRTSCDASVPPNQIDPDVNCDPLIDGTLLPNVDFSDDNYVFITLEKISPITDPAGWYRFWVNMSTIDIPLVSFLNFSIEQKSGFGLIQATFYLWNFSSEQWWPCGTVDIGFDDQIDNCTVNNISSFINSTTGDLYALVWGVNNNPVNNDQWSVDYMYLDIANKFGKPTNYTDYQEQTITAQPHTTVRWQWFASDIMDQWNQSDIFSFKTGQTVNVSNVSATPQLVLNNTVVNITAIIQSRYYGPGGIGPQIAMVYYPNGSFYRNLTLNPQCQACGDVTWHFNDSLIVNFDPSGQYNVTIYANDSKGNINSSEMTSFAPWINYTNRSNISMDAYFGDWKGIWNYTDYVNDIPLNHFVTLNDSKIIEDITIVPTPTTGFEFLMQWNISIIPSNSIIWNSSLTLTVISDNGDGDIDIELILNQSINLTYDDGTTLDDAVAINTTYYRFDVSLGPNYFNITNHTQSQSYNGSGLFTLRAWDDDLNPNSDTKGVVASPTVLIGGTATTATFHSKDAALQSNRPIMNVLYQWGDTKPYDLKSFSITNNFTNLFLRLESNSSLDFRPERYYRFFIGVNGSIFTKNTTPDSGLGLPFNYTYMIESYNNSLWRVYNSSDINIFNLSNGTNFINNSNQLEMQINLTSLGLKDKDKINITVETGFDSDRYDMLPNFYSYVEYTIDADSINVSNAMAMPKRVLNNTPVNISSTIISKYGTLNTIRAVVYYPNGTFFENRSMTNDGSGITYYNATNATFYPHGQYNVTIWAIDDLGVIGFATTDYAPYVNYSNSSNIDIDSSFVDWRGVLNITDVIGDSLGPSGRAEYFNLILDEDDIVEDIYVREASGENYFYEFFIQFNLSKLPKNVKIVNSNLSLNTETIGDATNGDMFISRVPNQSISLANDDANTLAGAPSINESLTSYYRATYPAYVYFNITNQTLAQVDNGSNLFTLKFSDPDNPVSPSINDKTNNTLLVFGKAGGAYAPEIFKSKDHSNVTARPLLNITYSAGYGTDLESFSVTNNNSNLFLRFSVNQTLNFSYDIYYRIFIGVNGTTSTRNKTPDTNMDLPFNYTYMIESFNNSLFRVYNSSDVQVFNISNGTDFGFSLAERNVEIKINLSSFGLNLYDKINITVETGDSNQRFDIMPDYYSYLEFMINYNISFGPPPYFTNPANASENFRIHFNFTANITIWDDIALNYTWFSHNNSGSGWQNLTPVAIGGLTTYNLNISQNITLVRNSTICWKVYANDSMGQVNVSDMYCFVVQNTLPGKVVLSNPVNNSEIEDRQPYFNWTPAYNPDNDSITYRIYIMQKVCSDPYQCQFTTINDSVTNQTNYTPIKIFDVDSVYNWTVIANDTYGDSPISEVFNFTINSLIAITFNNSYVNFSAMFLGDKDNTSDNIPEPLRIENDGNIHVNLSIKANLSLWARQPLNSEYFRFMAGNSSEPYSFNWSGSQTSWANWQNVSNLAILMLNWSNATDLAEIEILIEVPIDEYPGTKQTNITIEAS